AGGRLAADRRFGLNELASGGAAIDRQEAGARQRLEIETGEGVFVELDVISQLQRDPHVIRLEANLADGPGFHARDADLRAGIQPLDVGEFRPHAVAAREEAGSDGRLDEPDEEQDAAEEEETDTLFPGESHCPLLCISDRDARRTQEVARVRVVAAEEVLARAV